jgi:hypothetical protein
MSQVEEMSLDDVYEEQEVAVETIEEPVETETVEATEETVEEAPEEKAEESTTDSEKKPEEWTLTAVMDEREKRQKAVAEAEELRQKLAEYEKPTGEDVSVFEDEKAFIEAQDRKLKDEVNNAALNMSQAFANQTFGKDKVDAAAEWFKQEGIKSPSLIERYSSAELPYHEVVAMHEEEQARLDPDAYKAKIRAEVLKEVEASKPPEPESITPSLASKRSAGKASTNVTEDFEDILKP